MDSLPHSGHLPRLAESSLSTSQHQHSTCQSCRQGLPGPPGNPQSDRGPRGRGRSQSPAQITISYPGPGRPSPADRTRRSGGRRPTDRGKAGSGTTRTSNPCPSRFQGTVSSGSRGVEACERQAEPGWAGDNDVDLLTRTSWVDAASACSQIHKVKMMMGGNRSLNNVTQFSY